MNSIIKKITVSALSVFLTVGCTGCAEVTNLLEEHNIKIPYLTSDWRKGDNASAGETAAEGATGSAETAQVQEPAEQLSIEEQRRMSEGKNLNIYCWDESLESLFIMYYPGYEDIGDRKGRIGDVTVNWILPEEEGKYMDLLAEKLLTAEYLGADERVDLYLAPEEDLAIYVNSDYSLDVREKVGLTDEELEDQFPFTQQMASTDMGILKAVTWQASPGVCVYRRSIARDVLGTDDPNAVQKELADWTKFQTTAAEMKKKEYFMVSGYYDTFAPYRFTADRHWENDGKMVIPEAMVQWRDMMDSFTKNAYHNKTQIGEKEWLADQGPAGKVFCFFRAINDIDSRMAAYSLADANMAPEEGNGIYGDYAVCCGPQSYCTGGVWILAAPSTDNLLLDREIMENLTCNSTLLYKIAQNEEIFTNTVSGMRRLAGENKTDSFLGGQNPFQVYYEAASRLNCLPAGNYDRWMGDTYRNNMIKSFTGELDRDEAMELFYTRVRDRYPELDIDD